MNPFQSLWRALRRKSDLNEEIQSHIRMAVADRVARGESPADARRWAMREFGNVPLIADVTREGWGGLWLERTLQDLQLALRQLRRSPGFALTAILIMSLAIAANVIVFGVVKAMILQPLDVAHPDRVVAIAPHDGSYPVASYPEVRDLREANTVFSSVAAEVWDVFGLDAGKGTRPVWGDEVSTDFFEVMGIRPFLGRLLQPSDNAHPGASQAVVLSWPTWNSDFGADPAIVGKVIRINKQPYTIVGVTARNFYGTQKFLQPGLYVPMVNEASLDGVNWLEDRRAKNIFPIARLKDGVTKAQAQAELDAIAARIRRLDPKNEDNLEFKLATPGLIGDFLGRPARRFMAGVMVLAGILLLAACANLGGLFAARAADRTREIAIRIALGSSRWRVVRQVMTEALLLACAGGACAYALAWTALTGLAQWHPPSDYPIKFQVEPQPGLILVAFLISVAAGLLFGLLPLRQIFSTDPNDAIKSGSSRLGKQRKWALRDVLLSAQIALCCVTITAAFVSLLGLKRSVRVDKGFNPNDVVLTRFDLSQAAYSGEAAEHFQRQLLERVQAMPGVKSAGYAHATPLSDTPTSAVFAQQTVDFRPSNKVFDTFFYNISPGFLMTAEMPLLAGRDFRWSDTAQTPRVAIVNQIFARHLFHTEQAVGRLFKDAEGHTIQVIGVVADGKYFTLSEDPQEAAYFPILQQPSTETTLIARIQAGSSIEATNGMAGSIRKLIHGLDPGIPIRVSGSWYNALAFNLFPTEVATVSLGLFGAFGLLLSIAGTFGLATYTVSKRLRELSIRVALGAQARQVMSAALGRMLFLLASGSLVGLLLGVATGRVLSSIVFQASAQDPFVMGSVIATLLVTGLLSVAGPVRRVLHLDPARLLREE